MEETQTDGELRKTWREYRWPVSAMTLLERMAQQGHVGRGLLDLLRDHAKRQPVHTTLRGLVHHGRHARSGFVARNLREQLCVRLSHQAERLRRFPKGEGTTYHLEQLLRVHVDTFQELHDMGGVVERIMPGSREQSLLLQKCDPLDDFRRCIDAINNRHTANVETLMEAKREASRHWEGEEAEESLQQLIDEFLQMHISFQLLCRHFLLSLKTPDAKNDSARTGMVAEKCLLRSVVADAVGETQLITEHHLADSPDVIIEGDVNARATCIPSHVHHILFEVLKNALRATAVKHGRVADSLPPVRVRIAKLLVVAADPVWPDECAVGDATARSELGPLFPVSNLLVFLPKGKEQASVTVSDQGGGMGLATTRNAFRYLWTSSETYHEAQRKHRANASYQPANDPLSGMGIGLPLSRLYARHFGGDLGMLSLQGYGTHVALFMPLLEDGVEHLPSILR